MANAGVGARVEWGSGAGSPVGVCMGQSPRWGSGRSLPEAEDLMHPECW